MSSMWEDPHLAQIRSDIQLLKCDWYSYLKLTKWPDAGKELLETQGTYITAMFKAIEQPWTIMIFVRALTRSLARGVKTYIEAAAPEQRDFEKHKLFLREDG